MIERELHAAQDLARRRRAQTLLAAASALVILALGGFATWTYRKNARNQQILADERASQVAQLQKENGVLSQVLRQEYQERFAKARISLGVKRPSRRTPRRSSQTGARYEQAVSNTSIPWYFLAIIHGMETGFDFNTHLHNGDPFPLALSTFPKDVRFSGRSAVHVGTKRCRCDE